MQAACTKSLGVSGLCNVFRCILELIVNKTSKLKLALVTCVECSTCFRFVMNRTRTIVITVTMMMGWPLVLLPPPRHDRPNYSVVYFDTCRFVGTTLQVQH